MTSKKEVQNYEQQGYKKYEELPDSEYESRFAQILDEWKSFLAQEDPSLEACQDYFVHKKNLFEVIRRCDKRNLYYYVFHELEDICEYKEVAIRCFWILTLKPFMVVNEASKIYNSPNELFAFYLIFSTIACAYYEVYHKKIEYPSKERIKDIIYDFKYCSFSREAMIAFVETLADTYGVGISYIFQKSKPDIDSNTSDLME